jgi:hypothetical protein
MGLQFKVQPSARTHSTTVPNPKVYLLGSERSKKAETVGRGLKETSGINQSIMWLGRCGSVAWFAFPPQYWGSVCDKLPIL